MNDLKDLFTTEKVTDCNFYNDVDVYMYSNPHPKGVKTNDCVVRACTYAFSNDYLHERRQLNRVKKDTKHDSYKSTKFLKMYLKKFKWTAYQAVKGEPRMNGTTFAITHPEGTYILKMAGHVVTCIDGILLDTWDCSSKCVYGSWKIR